MMRRLLAAIAVAVAALALGATPAAAFYGAPVSLTSSVGSVAAGESVTFSGAGFAATSQVIATAVANGVVCARTTLSADDEGKVSFSFALDCAGTVTVTLAGMNVKGERMSTSTVVMVAAGRVEENPADPADPADPAADPAGTGGDAGTEGDGDAGDFGGLPKTGGSLLPLWGGLGLVATGGAVMVAAGRRKRQHD